MCYTVTTPVTTFSKSSNSSKVNNNARFNHLVTTVTTTFLLKYIYYIYSSMGSIGIYRGLYSLGTHSKMPVKVVTL